MSPDEQTASEGIAEFIQYVGEYLEEYNNEFDLGENFDEFGEGVYDKFVALFGEITFKDDEEE